jgi:hypothetical protein
MRSKPPLLRCSFLLGAIVAVGCSSGSTTPAKDGSAGADGATGSGGSDGGADHAGGASGNDGGADHAAGGSGGADSGATVDAPDAGHGDTGPCTTSVGAGNTVLFAFDGGANAKWYQFVGDNSDLAHSGLTTSLGASFTEGASCVGALQFAVNFTAYGPPNAHGESGQTEYYYSANPGQDWSAYKTLHASIKVETADYLGLDGVHFYVKSANQTKYREAVGTGQTLSNGLWLNLSIDLTDPGTLSNGVTASDVQLIGFEVLLKMAPPAGAPSTPSQAILLVDDIWLEALGPHDGGAD